MEPLSAEWKLWAIVNGVPAFIGGVLFLSRSAAAPERAGGCCRTAIGHFDQRFAWNIAARRDALLLGVGYVMRGLLFLHIWLATTWQDIRWILSATSRSRRCCWWSRWSGATSSTGVGSPPIGWLFLYIEEPIWMLTLVAGATAGGVPLVAPGPGCRSLLVAALLVRGRAVPGGGGLVLLPPTDAGRSGVVTGARRASSWAGPGGRSRWPWRDAGRTRSGAWPSTSCGSAGVAAVYLLRRDRDAWPARPHDGAAVRGSSHTRRSGGLGPAMTATGTIVYVHGASDRAEGVAEHVRGSRESLKRDAAPTTGSSPRPGARPWARSSARRCCGRPRPRQDRRSR